MHMNRNDATDCYGTCQTQEGNGIDQKHKLRDER
jgi:hypothetical protein